MLVLIFPLIKDLCFKSYVLLIVCWASSDPGYELFNDISILDRVYHILVNSLQFGTYLSLNLRKLQILNASFKSSVQGWLISFIPSEHGTAKLISTKSCRIEIRSFVSELLTYEVTDRQANRLIEQINTLFCRELINLHRRCSRLNTNKIIPDSRKALPTRINTRKKERDLFASKMRFLKGDKNESQRRSRIICFRGNKTWNYCHAIFHAIITRPLL